MKLLLLVSSTTHARGVMVVHDDADESALLARHDVRATIPAAILYARLSLPIRDSDARMLVRALGAGELYIPATDSQGNYHAPSDYDPADA
jgi:hypothetical protein